MIMNVINLGVIPIIVKDKNDARNVGEYVEKLVKEIIKSDK